MRIIEKTTRTGGRSVEVVELIPERDPEASRIKWGLIGLALVLTAICFYLAPAGAIDRFRLKGIVILGATGGYGVLWALSRTVYRGIVNRELNVGRRFLGLTLWKTRIPLAEDIRLDISRNDHAEILVKVLRPSEELVVEIGPFVDGDQAVQASSLLRPRKTVDTSDDNSSLDAAAVIRSLEGQVKPWFLQLVALLLIGGAFLAGIGDKEWLDAGITCVIGIAAVIFGLVYVSPISGVYYDSDDGENVEYWTRQGWFHRLDHQSSLVEPTSPVYLKRRFHYPSVAWLMLAPLFVGAVVVKVLFLMSSL
jgi:hypothetical protein